MARYLMHRRLLRSRSVKPEHGSFNLRSGARHIVLARARRRAADGKGEGAMEALRQEIASLNEAGATLHRAKKAAEAASEAKTRYLVAVSHEIRSPLNAIYGYAQLLERDESMSCGEAGAVIRRSAEHLTNLVEGLLEISRIESGVLKVRSDVVNLRGMLEQVIEMFRMQAASKGLDIELVFRDPVPDYVKTDEKRLRQVLINLVSNAVKYTREGGATITVGYRSQVVDVKVSDTGIGIAQDDLQRVFEPFERGSSPEAQVQPGIGLGLAITQVLVRVMGGDLTAISTPGVGSTFRLRLMLPEPTNFSSGAAQGRRITGYHGPRRTVLVIDDDPAQSTVLQSFLHPLGFLVHVAGNGPEGVALARDCSPDIVLLDLQMPGMRGWDVAARLRTSLGTALRIVIVSADAHEFRAGGDGCSDHDAFVTKPIDLDELLVLIGNQLGLRWKEKEEAREAEQPQALAPLPVDALPFLSRLRHLAKIGHVRGIDVALDEFGRDVPDAAQLVSVLRRHAGDFDLRSLIRTLDHAERS